MRYNLIALRRTGCIVLLHRELTTEGVAGVALGMERIVDLVKIFVCGHARIDSTWTNQPGHRDYTAGGGLARNLALRCQSRPKSDQSFHLVFVVERLRKGICKGAHHRWTSAPTQSRCARRIGS